MLNNNPYQAYHKTKVETASQGALILMLFDGAVKFCKAALQGLENDDYEMVNVNIIKAQNILNELMITLDTEAGGEVAKNLYSIYDFLYWRLITANIKKSSEIINDVVEKLLDLRHTWEEVIKLSRTGSNQSGGVDTEV